MESKKCLHEEVAHSCSDGGCVRDNYINCVSCKKELEYWHTCQWDDHDCGSLSRHDEEWKKRVSGCKHLENKNKGQSKHCSQCGSYLYQ